MKKNLFLILLLFLFQSVFSQIKDNVGNDIPAVYYYCPTENLRLSVDDYALSSSSSITYEDVSNYSTLLNTAVGELDVPFSVPTRDNVFSKSINLGFSFQFFGINYNKVVVGTNGRLVFTNDTVLDNLNDNVYYTDRTFSEPAVSVPNRVYNQVYKSLPTDREIPLAQIFAGFTRLRSNSGTTFYKYKPVVDAGVKGMVFTFQDVIPHNGVGADYGGRYTSKVLIFEDGRVIINVNGKLNATYNAIVGMQNENATEYLIPDHKTVPTFNYNNGYWTSESSTAFVFKTGITRTPTYSWKLNGIPVSNTRFYPNIGSYTPNDGDKITVDITFTETGISPIHDEVTFKSIKTPVISSIKGDCGVYLRISDATYDPNLIYEWYRDGVIYTDITATSSQQVFVHKQITPMGNFYVKAKKPDGKDCGIQSNSPDLSKERYLPFGDSMKAFCGTDSTPKILNLYDLFYPEYTAASGVAEYFVDFFENGTKIADPKNYLLTANSVRSMYMDVKTEATGSPCITSGLSLEYISAPDKLDITSCSTLSTYNLKNYFNPIYGRFHISYSYADGTSAGDGSSVDTSKKVLVKILGTTGRCFTITEVNFSNSGAFNIPKIPIQERCAGSNTVIANWFDLASVKNMLDPAGQYDVKFYRKTDNTELAISNADGSQLSGTDFWTNKTGDYIIYAILYSKTDPTCFGQSDDIILRVYRKPSIISSNPIIKSNCFGNTIFDLTQAISSLTNASPPVNPNLEYYSQTNQLLSASQITNYDAATYGTQPYIKVIYNPTCSDIVKFDLKYNPKPVSKISQISVCDETTYSGDAFKNQVIDNASQYTFYEKDGVTPLRSSFNLSTLPLVVEFYIKNNVTNCISDLQTVTFVKGGNSVLTTSLTNYVLCDVTPDNFDGKTAFNLDSKKSDFTTVPGTIFKYYKDAAYTQEITNPTNYINETLFSQTVYVKIKVPNYCPSDAIINLRVNTATKSRTLLDKYFICFGDTVLVDAGTENTTYNWSNGGNAQTKTFTQAGNYSVTLTNSNGCSYTHNFVISDENQPKIDKINQTEQQIEVIASGKYNIEYSFDGGMTWQTSNILMNPTALQYDIQVRSVLPNGTYCLGEIKSIFTINIHNVITPNGDGKNDTWFVENLDKMDEVEIIISDRYGKAVFHTTFKNNLIWNGMYNGRVLPTSSYWYIVKWFDPSTQKSEIRQGWILLKNRN